MGAGKRGVGQNEFLGIALLVLALVIAFIIYGILSGHGTSVINFFRDLVRFGR